MTCHLSLSGRNRTVTILRLISCGIFFSQIVETGLHLLLGIKSRSDTGYVNACLQSYHSRAPRQEYHEFEAHLDYTVSSRPDWATL